ncbi:CLUMA_CG021295, isoform A [Clunio marinus]|uniref:CLUMA_CG021295, isoform A n=1 Tax=Clunio marinus TaxID=568069 RepID=A0A1J1J7H1_9DIPT|nr:CLUMA_CG021295, isoform A [Clunio marinus]
MASTSKKMASTSKETASTNKEVCWVCFKSIKNDVLFGEWKTLDKIKVHYFCLLSGTAIRQTGKVTGKPDGILGFTEKDIGESFQLYESTKCYLCRKKSAAVKCAEKDCNRSWHYPCGVLECVTEFTGAFQSYCSHHVKDPNNGKKHENYAECLVCNSLIATYDPANSIISSCCLLWPDYSKCFVHKTCILKYTKNAGYDSLCINCDMEVPAPNYKLTKQEWQEEMRKKGIFIPMADAIWEREGNFADQVKQKCEYGNCSSPNVTKDVFTCFVCGCFPMHLKCSKVTKHEEYYCPKCWDQSFVQRVPKY